MSKKTKPFTSKELGEYNPDDIRLNLIQNGEQVFRCTVDEKRTFLGLLPRWVHRADLLKPIQDVDMEIQKKKDELVALEAKREAKIRETRMLVASIGHTWQSKPYKLNSKDSKPDAVEGLFSDTSEKKPKKKEPRVLNSVKATGNHQQNNGKKGNNNNGNH